MRSRHTQTKSSKKSQVSIFIIMGMVILIVIFMILSLVDFEVKTKQKSTEISYYIEDCLGQLSEHGLRLSAIRGGVIEPENTINGLNLKEGYIDKEIFEREVEKYINDNIGICKIDIAGKEINYGVPDAKVNIGEKATFVNLDMDVEVIEKNTQSFHNRFSAMHNFKLGFMIEVMNKSLECFDLQYLKTTGLQVNKYPRVIALKDDDFYLAAGYN